MAEERYGTPELIPCDLPVGMAVRKSEGVSVISKSIFFKKNLSVFALETLDLI